MRGGGGQGASPGASGEGRGWGHRQGRQVRAGGGGIARGVR